MANVLVYSGEGVAYGGLPHVVESLSRLCGHAYDVQMINSDSLSGDPWDTVTKLLVLPGGTPQAYQAALGPAAPRIKAFLENGGALLAMGGAAAFACGSFRYAEDTPQHAFDGFGPLRLFPGTYWGPVFAAGNAANVATSKGSVQMAYNGGGAFLRAEAFGGHDIDVLAEYATPTRTPPSELGAANVAGIACGVGAGKALLFGVCPVTPMVPYGMPPGHGPDALRLQCLAHWLATEAAMHIEGPAVTQVGPPSITDPPRLTPYYVASRGAGLALPRRTDADATAQLPTVAAAIAQSDGGLVVETTVKDTNDLYALVRVQRDAAANIARLHEACLTASYAPFESEGTPDLHRVPKILLQLDAPLSEADAERIAPFFVLPRYFDALDAARRRLTHLPWPAAPLSIRIGDVVAYGQVVTSTQTMLEKNTALLQAAPLGTTFLATHQIAGRGRGKNAWISPCGCLQFSTRLALPASAGTKSVFLQYLAALAIVYGLSEGLGEASDALRGRIRIKWPNDVYAQVRDAPPSAVRQSVGGEERAYVKLGGILVNALYANGRFELVVGCGVNVTNPRPTTSVAEVVQTFGRGNVTQEACAAAIFAAFEKLASAFEAAHYDFAPFAAAYRAAWLHDNQEISLEGERVRIVGITSNYGLLRTVPLSSPLTSADAAAWCGAPVAGCIDLQPDGNSFDMLQNLVHRKS